MGLRHVTLVLVIGTTKSERLRFAVERVLSSHLLVNEAEEKSYLSFESKNEEAVPSSHNRFFAVSGPGSGLSSVAHTFS